MFKQSKFLRRDEVLPILLFLIVFPFALFSQYPDWINYTNGQYVSAVAVKGNEIWIGAGCGGLVMLDTITDSMTFYNHANSGLPNNCVFAIAIVSCNSHFFVTVVDS